MSPFTVGNKEEGPVRIPIQMTLTFSADENSPHREVDKIIAVAQRVAPDLSYSVHYGFGDTDEPQ